MAKIMKVIVNQPTKENKLEFEKKVAKIAAEIFIDILPTEVVDELIRRLKMEQK